MTTSNTDFFTVGKIVNTHGVKGEVRVIATTDFADERFAPGTELQCVHPNGVRERLKVTHFRPHKQFYLLTFSGYDSLDTAENLKGSTLEIHKSKREELPETEFYYDEIIGAKVYTEEGRSLGTVKEILSPGANDVWIVQPGAGKKEILLPYIEEVVRHVDVKEQRVTVRLLEGLLDE